MMTEFNIGDRVVVKEFEDIPSEGRTRAVAKFSGLVGTVKDKLFSTASNDYIYVVHFDEYEKESNKMWRADHLTAYVEPKKEYNLILDYADNVVVVIITEDGKEVGRGHGHIIHEGSIGIVQAASYALKKIYERRGGTF